MSDLKPLATRVAKRYGIPVGILHGLIQQESGWNPAARNPSGATGLMQIHLPSHPNVTEQQALNPRFAINWGAKYLASQYKRFGSWKLALAAYNAGPGNVENGRWQTFPETRNYVKSVLSFAGATPQAETPASNTVPAPSPTPAAVSPGLPELPASGPALAGLALQNLSALTGPKRDRPSPLDMLSGLTSAVASTPSQLPAPSAAPVPPPSAGAPVPEEPSPTAATGFVPAFETGLTRLLRDYPQLKLVSGYRSPEKQAQLYRDAVRKHGSEQAARKWVAPPGKSKHNHGVAADLGGDLSVLSDAVLSKYGLYRPMSWEPWHVELRGSRG